MKPPYIIATIVAMTTLLVVALPMLSTYLQWIVDGHSSSVLWVITILGFSGLVAIVAIGGSMFDDWRRGR